VVGVISLRGGYTANSIACLNATKVTLQFLRVKHCAISEIEAGGETSVVVSMNDTCHLA
jgi:hypothetical protein